MVAASVLTTAGCFLRSGIDPSHLPDYDMIRLGTAFVGFSQPFFQCSPPLLSATWFGARDRATATGAALVRISSASPRPLWLVAWWWVMMPRNSRRTFLIYPPRLW